MMVYHTLHLIEVQQQFAFDYDAIAMIWMICKCSWTECMRGAEGDLLDTWASGTLTQEMCTDRNYDLVEDFEEKN